MQRKKKAYHFAKHLEEMFKQLSRQSADEDATLVHKNDQKLIRR